MSMSMNKDINTAFEKKKKIVSEEYEDTKIEQGDYLNLTPLYLSAINDMWNKKKRPTPLLSMTK